MKRILLALSILICVVSAQAAPVGVEEARLLGQRFVQAHFDFASQSDDLSLVYSQPAFYVFNVGNTGFVILSSDDSYRPVIGYSDEGTFHPDDMAPALQEYLDGINAYRMSRNAVATSEVAAEWNLLREHGRLESRYGGRDDVYLVQTKWNQNYPYNYCCPADSDGPGGHVYAGCVATAAAQLMKYWNHPLHGTGSHTYTPEDHPEYGPLTVNFGNATYDWDNMPNTISSSSPIAQIEAVATLIYHCGVSVDMNYRPGSSGAVTGQLCNVMPLYFYYTNQMQNLYRENYTHEEYMQLIIDAIDMSWPMVHRGGGHAYVLDGYNDAGLVHFNWGWSGSNDGWFNVDEHNYTEGESVIYNYVPAEIYAATPNRPTNLTAVAADNAERSVTVTWNNPTVTLTNVALTSIDQVVVMRGNEIVHVVENPVPGEAMSFVDNTISCFDSYVYTVYAVLNGQRGKSAVSEKVLVGPKCQWKFVVSSSNFQGWRGAYISVRNMCGTEVTRVTTTNSTPAVVDMDLPLGWLKMYWVSSENTANFNISINIKDSDNNSVYSYSGLIQNMQEALLYEGNNGCGGAPDCGTPANLTAVQDEDDVYSIILQWEGVEDPGYGYLVYRDDKVIDMTPESNYRDENVPMGGHCYYVTALCEGGMTGEFTNMVCVSSGECYPPRHFNFETTANFKCKLTWDRPVPDNGLSGFILYRKKDGEEYKRIKLLGANATTHTDNSLSSEGDYYYKLVAYYQAIDCESAPAPYVYITGQYYIHFLYSIDGTTESGDPAVHIYPNPTTGFLNVEMPMMQSVSVYNLLGQCVLETAVNGDAVSLNLKEYGSGMFMVVVKTAEGIVTRKVSIIE